MPPRRKGLKLALVGETCAGKTALITRLLHSTFVDGQHKATEGCYRHNTAVRLDDGRKLPLQLWDTPGRASFQDIAQNYEPSPIANADGLIIVYDASSSKSASSLKKWVKAVRKAAPPSCRGMLMGTKHDRLSGGKTSPCYAKAVALAKSNGMRHAQVSAADEDSVADAVGKFIDLVVGTDARRQKQKLPLNVPSDKVVEVWLEQEGLGEYAEAFAAAGYRGQGCLAELQALQRSKLLLLCQRINGELPTPRPESEQSGPPPESEQSGPPTADPASSSQAVTSMRNEAGTESDHVPEVASQGSNSTSNADPVEAVVEISVPDILARRGLGVYASLFDSAGYSGAACAAELAELALDELEKLCFSLEKPFATTIDTNALQLHDGDCVELAAWLSVRGPYGTMEALSRLRYALQLSNPHSDDNATMIAKSGVIAPLVALFLTGVTSPGGNGGGRGKVGNAELAKAALDVCAELSRSPAAQEALIYIGVVDALPHLLELEATTTAATRADQSTGSVDIRSAGDGGCGSATMLLLRMCGSDSQGAVDALLHMSELVTLSARCLLGLHMQTGIAIALTERLAPIVFDGGGDEHYAAALGLLRYDATVASGVGLPHGSLPEPSAYTALLQVARAVMRDRLLRIVDGLRLTSCSLVRHSDDVSSTCTDSSVEEWEVVAVETAARELIETVAAHSPLSSDVVELNGVQALLRLLDTWTATTAGTEQADYQRRVADAVTRALGQLCATDAQIVAMVAAAGKGHLATPPNERPLDVSVEVVEVEPKPELDSEPDKKMDLPALSEHEELSPAMPPSDDSDNGSGEGKGEPEEQAVAEWERALRVAAVAALDSPDLTGQATSSIDDSMVADDNYRNASCKHEVRRVFADVDHPASPSTGEIESARSLEAVEEISSQCLGLLYQLGSAIATLHVDTMRSYRMATQRQRLQSPQEDEAAKETKVLARLKDAVARFDKLRVGMDDAKKSLSKVMVLIAESSASGSGSAPAMLGAVAANDDGEKQASAGIEVSARQEAVEKVEEQEDQDEVDGSSGEGQGGEEEEEEEEEEEAASGTEDDDGGEVAKANDDDGASASALGAVAANDDGKKEASARIVASASQEPVEKVVEQEDRGEVDGGKGEGGEHEGEQENGKEAASAVEDDDGGTGYEHHYDGASAMPHHV